MALYYLLCPSCLQGDRRFLACRSDASRQACGACGATMKRDPHPPSVQVVEALDNGVMARRVERLKDAEVLHKDRSANDPRMKPI